jgi:hypothetical protein
VTLSAPIFAHQHVPDSDRTAAPKLPALTAYEMVIGSSDGPEVNRSPGSYAESVARSVVKVPRSA